MKSATQSVEQSPRLIRIQLEYDDGTRDCITPLPDHNTMIPLYGWRRDRPEQTGIDSAYTCPAIAALLFQTALARHLTDYSSIDPRIVELLQGNGPA